MNCIKTSIFRKTARQLDAKAKKELLAVITQIENAESLTDLPHVKEMKGSQNKGFFRIRFGQYRLGFFLEADGDIELREVGSRGDFYKTFP